MPVFPTIYQARDWYIATKDGLGSLGAYVWKNTTRAMISAGTLDELFGMTEQNWRSYYERNLDRHELFSSLALFAACEGGIRQDFEWRMIGTNGQKHHLRFRKLTKDQTAERIALATILENWLAAEKQNKWLHSSLQQLMTLFAQRNDHAHGRTNDPVAFDPIFDKLNQIRAKWLAGVGDFRGY